jgi:hypothetical protein
MSSVYMLVGWMVGDNLLLGNSETCVIIFMMCVF